jgi:hypothetical protein
MNDYLESLKELQSQAVKSGASDPGSRIAHLEGVVSTLLGILVQQDSGRGHRTEAPARVPAADKTPEHKGPTAHKGRFHK